MNPLLSVKDLSFRYGDEIVLEDITFNVPLGDYLGIVGPNGSGKSTLLKLILGILPLQHGKIEIFGKPLSEFREWEKIGYVPQQVFRGDLNFPATVREIVETGHLGKEASLWCQLGWKQCRSIEEALAMAEIEHLADRRIGELSGGERQRVFIARALVSHPALLLLDEPTAGVDVTSQESFYAFLHKLNMEHGMSIVLVSHDLEIIAHEAKTALALNQKVVYHGTAEGLHSLEVLQKVFGERALHPHFHESV